MTVLVKHGPHVSGLRARERATPPWESGLSTTYLEFPLLPFCARARLFARAEVPMFAEEVVI